MSVEQELWNIFTYYTLYNNPLDPERMNKTQLLKLCRECKILDMVSQPQVGIYYQTELQRKMVYGKDGEIQSVSNAKVLNFSNFLNVLVSIGKAIYETTDSNIALPRLLMEIILPVAPRRNVISISTYLEDRNIRALLYGKFKNGLKNIYTYYCNQGEFRILKIIAKTRGTNKSGNVVTIANKSLTTKTLVKSKQVHALHYEEYIQFISDYQLANTSMLTSIELGDVFLSTVRQGTYSSDGALQPLTLDEFLEVIVRIALQAYHNANKTTTSVDKIKSFFLFLWRNITNPNRSKLNLRDSGRMDTTKVAGGDLNICGSALFNRLVLQMWREDGYRDYSGEENSFEEGKEILSKMSLKSSSTSYSTYDVLPKQSWEQENEGHDPTKPMDALNILAQNKDQFNSLSSTDNQGGGKLKSKQEKKVIPLEKLKQLLSQRPDIGVLLNDAMIELDIVNASSTTSLLLRVENSGMTTR